MKLKGIVLSVLLSLGLMAGGDISPVKSVTPDSADFWGSIGFAYQANDVDGGYSFSDPENNLFSSAVVLGVEKEIGYGFGFGAEVAGWSDFGIDTQPYVFKHNAFIRQNSDGTSAEVSQAYVMYKNGNFSAKAGRFALPKEVSPFAWSDRSVGVIDESFEGVQAAYTFMDNTIYGAWIKNIYMNQEFDAEISDNGMFMGGVISKGIPGTVISVQGYYIPESEIDINRVTSATPKDVWSIWGSVEGNIDGFNGGIQGAYVDGDYNAKETYAIAGKIGGTFTSTFGNVNLEGIAGYKNDGGYSLIGGGSGIGTSAFWIDSDVLTQSAYFGVGNKEYYGVIGKGSVQTLYGKIYGEVGYWDFDNSVIDKAYGGKVGYEVSFTDIPGLGAKVEYQILENDLVNTDVTEQRIKLEAFYRF